MADILYSYEKLGAAAQELAVHRGAIKERLTDAVNHLAMVDPKIFDDPNMPSGAKGMWNKIWSTITTAPKDDRRGVFGPSIDRLSEEQASEIAQLIVSVEAMVGSVI